jgi:hypothetical protein
MLKRLYNSELARTWAGTLSISTLTWIFVFWFVHSQTGHWPHIWLFA